MSELHGNDSVVNENQMPEIPLEVKQEMDPVETAAMTFTQLLPYVTKIANATVSKGSLVRVLHALTEFPLGQGKPRLLNDTERQLFQICQEINQHKTTVLNSIVQRELELQKQKTKEKTNE